jgi:hypothetical protein
MVATMGPDSALTWQTEAMSMSPDALTDETLQIHDHVVDILQGTVAHSRWAGHGASLCVRGLVLIQVGREREIFNPGGGWEHVFKFLIQAQFMMTALGERIEKPKNDEGKKRMNVEGKEKQPKSSSALICKVLSCSRRPGFTNIGTAANQWWVCGSCLRPTERWFKSQGDAMLNMFRGGPLSGMVYDSTMLLTDLRLAHVVLGYKWTNEILKSETTQQEARVWLFSNEQPDRVTPSGQPTAMSSPLEGATMTAEPTPEVPQVPDAPATPEPAAVVEPVDVSDLLTKRNSLKLSRTVVANKADVTVAQLYRIEQGGKRTTQAEADKVRQALRELEADQPAPAAEGETAANPA